MNFDRDLLLEKLSEGARAMKIDLQPQQCRQMIDYLALLTKWNAVYNLTAIRDPQQMVVQHLLDSLAAAPAFEKARHVLDVGAGGGFPGMVLAIWAQQANPGMRLSLVDTVQKKTAFLNQAKAELGLTAVTVYTARVEQLEVANRFDVITSRAFADLADFVSWSGHLLADPGRFIAMKGTVPVEEINRLPEMWKVSQVQPLEVPGLHAQRHLIYIERTSTETSTED